MRSSKSVRGFTLVELLVVIAVVGILVSLLLPAVQAAREAARRLQCVNNLKQLALGCLNHESSVRTFPTGGWFPVTLGHPDAGTGITQPGSWLFCILPYIEQVQLHRLQSGYTCTANPLMPQPTATLEADIAPQVMQTPVSLFYCPSRRAAALYPNLATKLWRDVGWIHYPGNDDLVACYDPGATHFASTWAKADMVVRSDYAGNCSRFHVMAPPQVWPSNVGYLLDDAWDYGTWHASRIWLPAASSAGASTNQAALLAELATSPLQLPNNGVIYMFSATTMADVQDGTSNTCLAGEKYIDALHYTDGATFGDDWCAYCGHGWDPDTVRECDNPPRQDCPGYNSPTVFGSAHAGAFNMAFCDGSVHQISYAIGATVYANLGNRHDGNAIDASVGGY